MIRNINLATVPFHLSRFTYVAIVIWVLASIGIAAGTLYLTLITLSTILLFWAFFLFKEEQFIFNLIPFETDFKQLIFGYTVGFFIPLFLLLIASIFSLFSGVKNFYSAFVSFVFAPLVSFSLPGTVESFAAIKAQNNPFLTWFVVSPGASTLEEIVTGFAFFIISGFFVIGLVMLFDYIFKLRVSKSGLKKWFFWGGLIGSVLVFAGIHFFNDTYVGNPKLFLFAILFRLIVNSSIYLTRGLGIFFAIGLHQSNNNISLGLAGFFGGVLNPLGLLIILIDLILILGFFIKWKEMIEYGKTAFLYKKVV